MKEIDMIDLAFYIQKKTGLPIDTIETVLDVEISYMILNGFIKDKSQVF